MTAFRGRITRINPAADPATAPSVGYGGQPLTPVQAAEVRRYIDWIRARDNTS